jgi:hypothetical protein
MVFRIETAWHDHRCILTIRFPELVDQHCALRLLVHYTAGDALRQAIGTWGQFAGELPAGPQSQSADPSR